MTAQLPESELLDQIARARASARAVARRQAWSSGAFYAALVLPAILISEPVPMLIVVASLVVTMLAWRWFSIRRWWLEANRQGLTFDVLQDAAEDEHLLARRSSWRGQWQTRALQRLAQRANPTRPPSA